jgi:RNA polymerase sigma-70 factor, ECF subfamily
MALALTASDLLQDDAEPRPSSERPRSSRPEIDAATLAACQRGEPLALRRFVLCYQGLVFAFFSRTTGRGAHVEDLAQDLFIRAYRALPRFEVREGVRVSTWLLKIAVRLVQDARKRRRATLVPLTEHLPATHDCTPEDERRRLEMARAFERAAGELSEEQRVVFVLAHFHDLSMADIAAMTNAPEGTVKTRLFRAHERLRKLLLPVWESER